jgi:SagB-type dehydrogenase family enzyme
MNKEIRNLDQKVAESSELILDSGSSEIPEEWSRIFYKTYPRLEQVKLATTPVRQELLQEILLGRKSEREYIGPITFNELSNIIYYSCGLLPENGACRRMYPSAGARYPIECYILTKSVDNLSPGVYHYNVKKNTFETLLSEDISAEIEGMLINQNALFKNLSALFVLTTVLSRTEVKYGIHSYNFSLLEAGHIAQNMYLIAQTQRVGICAIGTLHRSKVNALLDLTEEEMPLCGLSCGKIPE